MDMIRPIATRIGDIAARHAYNGMYGRPGHGRRQLAMPDIVEYSGPANHTVMTAGRAAGAYAGNIENAAMRGVAHGAVNAARGAAKSAGGFLGAAEKVVGGVENVIGTGMRVAKAVAPFAPLLTLL